MNGADPCHSAVLAVSLAGAEGNYEGRKRYRQAVPELEVIPKLPQKDNDASNDKESKEDMSAPALL